MYLQCACLAELRWKGTYANVTFLSSRDNWILHVRYTILSDTLLDNSNLVRWRTRTKDMSSREKTPTMMNITVEKSEMFIVRELNVNCICVICPLFTFETFHKLVKIESQRELRLHSIRWGSGVIRTRMEHSTDRQEHSLWHWNVVFTRIEGREEEEHIRLIRRARYFLFVISSSFSSHRSHRKEERIPNTNDSRERSMISIIFSLITDTSSVDVLTNEYNCASGNHERQRAFRSSSGEL